MDNFEIAKALADLACEIDCQKVNIPNGHNWVDLLHIAAKDIAEHRACEIYNEPCDGRR